MSPATCEGRHPWECATECSSEDSKFAVVFSWMLHESVEDSEMSHSVAVNRGKKGSP